MKKTIPIACLIEPGTALLLDAYRKLTDGSLNNIINTALQKYLLAEAGKEVNAEKHIGRE